MKIRIIIISIFILISSLACSIEDTTVTPIIILQLTTTPSAIPILTYTSNTPTLLVTQEPTPTPIIRFEATTTPLSTPHNENTLIPTLKGESSCKLNVNLNCIN